MRTFATETKATRQSTSAAIRTKKLTIGAPRDIQEQEADRMSEQVMRMPEPLLHRPRAGGGRDPERQSERAGHEHERSQAGQSHASHPKQIAAPSIVHEALAAPGHPLDLPTRRFMESRFGHDFSRVRVHSDSKAADSARALDARAYTSGNNIYFDHGSYAPGSVEGKRLLAHELTHVVQQRSGSSSFIQRKPRDDSPGRQSEQDVAAEVEEAAGELPVPRRPSDPERVGVRYAFFYAGPGYGNLAREFIKTFYPDHRRITSSSFEQMFDQLYADLNRHRRRGEQLHVDEIVIVTHANADGGLTSIPLARDDVGRRRNFTPWDLAALQQEFQDRTHAAYRRRQGFRERRGEVVREAIDDDTRVVVRGCQFGQSQEALDALRSFFGGQPYVWAPTVFQYYDVSEIGRSHLKSAAEAIELLQRQELLPRDLELTDAEKAKFIGRAIPTESFVVDPKDYEALKNLDTRNAAVSDEAERLKTREDVVVPSLGGAGYWGLSAPDTGEDPELDGLSLDEIERRAKLLHDHYRPEYAPMLLRLRNAWERHPEILRRLARDKSEAPLAGLPPASIFGGSYVSVDAAKFRRAPGRDTFEDQELPFALPSEAAEKAYQSTKEEGALETPRAGRRVATPEELARARSSAKGRPRAPEPKEAAPEIPAARAEDEGVRAILEQLPEKGWQLSDTWTIVDLLVTAQASPTTIFVLPDTIPFIAWEASALLAPLLFAQLAALASLSQTAEVHRQASRALGVRLGLEHLASRVGDEGFSATSISADDLYEGVPDDPDVQSQIQYNVPFGGEHVLPNVRIGVEALAAAANETMRQAERNLRQALERGDLSKHDLEHAYSSMIVEYRRQALMALVRAGREAVRRRDEALEARRAAD